MNRKLARSGAAGLAACTVMNLFSPAPTGIWTGSPPIPLGTAWIGGTFTLQAAMVPTASPLGHDVTNGVVLVLDR